MPDKIYAVSEFVKPFVTLTTGYAYKALGEIFNCPVQIDDYPQWSRREFTRDDRDVLVFAEAAYIDYCRLTVQEIRSYYPNGKIIVLASDTIYYILNRTRQFRDIENVDLWLETMPQSIEVYQNYVPKIDLWVWTGSKKNFLEIEDYYKKHKHQKDIDFAAIWYVCDKDSYRAKLLQHLQDKGHSWLKGGEGHMDSAEKVYGAWSRSYFNIGTTSHNNPALSKIAMKGWRDWSGCFADSLLIYDDQPNIRKIFPTEVIPLYDFDNPQSILDVVHKVTYGNWAELLQLQKKWALANTIEIQLAKLLQKHGFAKIPE